MPEIQPADPRLRRRAIATVLATIAVAMIAYLMLAQRIDQLSSLPPAQARATLAHILGWSTLAVSILVATLGAYVWQLGKKIRHARRFPPPGTGVIRDTVVLTGEQARQRGRIAQFLGATLVVLSFALVLTMWRLTRLLGA